MTPAFNEQPKSEAPDGDSAPSAAENQRSVTAKTSGAGTSPADGATGTRSSTSTANDSQQSLSPMQAGVVMLHRIERAGRLKHDDAVRGLGYGHANNLRKWALENNLVSNEWEYGRGDIYKVTPEAQHYIEQVPLTPAAEALAADFEITRLTNE